LVLVLEEGEVSMPTEEAKRRRRRPRKGGPKALKISVAFVALKFHWQASTFLKLTSASHLRPPATLEYAQHVNYWTGRPGVGHGLLEIVSMGEGGASTPPFSVVFV
jgi:hypothetical protein